MGLVLSLPVPCQPCHTGRTGQESSTIPVNAAMLSRAHCPCQALHTPRCQQWHRHIPARLLPAEGCSTAKHEEDTVTRGTKEGSSCQTRRTNPEPFALQNQQQVERRCQHLTATGKRAQVGKEPGCQDSKHGWELGCPQPIPTPTTRPTHPILPLSWSPAPTSCSSGLTPTTTLQIHPDTPADRHHAPAVPHLPLPSLLPGCLPSEPWAHRVASHGPAALRGGRCASTSARGMCHGALRAASEPVPCAGCAPAARAGAHGPSCGASCPVH